MSSCEDGSTMQLNRRIGHKLAIIMITKNTTPKPKPIYTLIEAIACEFCKRWYLDRYRKNM